MTATTSPFAPATLADLPAFRCEHATDAEAGTGCTVVVAPQGATCGVDVRGGGPATRETDLLKPENMIEKVHAVVLSGGSAFGLATSTGVMDELAKRDIGFAVAGKRVPIVVSACLFDLYIGASNADHAELGRAAVRTALEHSENDASPATSPLAQGNVGAGCGATVGKMLGPEQAMKAGFGWHGLRLGSLVVVALVAVNALGQVRDAEGRWIAGAHDETGRVMDALEVIQTSIVSKAAAANATAAAPHGADQPCANTTIGVVLTNARISKAQAMKVSSTTHDAYARAIKPVHTQNDGDTIFTFASGDVPADTDTVAILATEAMQHAIESACLHAEPAYGLPAANDSE